MKQLEEDLCGGQVLQKLLGESPGGAVLELDRAVCRHGGLVHKPWA